MTSSNPQILWTPPLLLALDVETLLTTCVSNTKTYDQCRRLKNLLHQQHPDLDEELAIYFQIESTKPNPNRKILELIVYLMVDKERLLYNAILFEMIPIVNFLISQGLNLNLPGKIWDNPLYNAIQTRNTDMVRLLLDHGADPNYRYPHQETPLMEASKVGDKAMVASLVEHGAEVNAQDQMGMTPLMEALFAGKTLNARYLIEHGADLTTLRNKHNHTSADYFQYAKQDPALYIYLKNLASTK